MVLVSTISGEIDKLSKSIFSFENSLKSLPSQVITCGSDCFCRKEGKHKVTNSLYHKNCISMKKNPATVKKTDLVRPCNRPVEKKEVFQLGKAQVEFALKSSSKDILDKNSKSDKDGGKTRKFVETGTDPITTVEPKKIGKKWSSILSENSKQGGSNDGDIPRDHHKPHIMYTSSSQSGERCSTKRTVMVRDRGIQCQNGPKYESFDTSPYNQICSLQSIVNNLKGFQQKLNGQNEQSSLTSIISDLVFALDRLKETNYSKGVLDDNKKDFYCHPLSKQDDCPVEKTSLAGLATLQETCKQLQASCITLEQTCKKLQNEKDHVTEDFFEKCRELESCLKRELEYQAKLSDAKRSADAMSIKLERYTKSMEELSVHVSRLQTENKVLEHAEEKKAKLVSQLLEITNENEKLRNQVQLMALEKEKNVVLFELREQELNKLKSELRSIGGLVSEKMLETAIAGDSKMISSRFDLTDSREVIISSPDGSLKSPSKSWKAVSSIMSPQQPKRTRSSPPITTVTNDPVVPQVDRSMKNPLESINHLKNELRELFAQMKQQTELSETVVRERPRESDSSKWSSLTDTSDGYNSITENEVSEIT